MQIFAWLAVTSIFTIFGLLFCYAVFGWKPGFSDVAYVFILLGLYFGVVRYRKLKSRWKETGERCMICNAPILSNGTDEICGREMVATMKTEEKQYD